MSELSKIRDQYHRALSHSSLAHHRWCKEIAAENFQWVLDLAYEAETKVEPKKPHTIADNYGAGDLERARPCMFCEDTVEMENQRDAALNLLWKLVDAITVLSRMTECLSDEYGKKVDVLIELKEQAESLLGGKR